MWGGPGGSGLGGWCLLPIPDATVFPTSSIARPGGCLDKLCRGWRTYTLGTCIRPSCTFCTAPLTRCVAAGWLDSRECDHSCLNHFEALHHIRVVLPGQSAYFGPVGRAEAPVASVGLPRLSREADRVKRRIYLGP